jgi:hypothetical protein
MSHPVGDAYRVRYTFTDVRPELGPLRQPVARRKGEGSRYHRLVRGSRSDTPVLRHVGRAYAQVSPVIGGEVGVFMDYSMLSAAQKAQAHFADTDAPSGVEVKLDPATATSSAQLDLSVGQPAEQIQGLRMLGFQILWEWTDGDPRAHIARAVDSTKQLVDISVAYDPQDALLDIAERLLPRSDL